MNSEILIYQNSEASSGKKQAGPWNKEGKYKGDASM